MFQSAALARVFKKEESSNGNDDEERFIDVNDVEAVKEAVSKMVTEINESSAFMKEEAESSMKKGAEGDNVAGWVHKDNIGKWLSIFFIKLILSDFKVVDIIINK